MRAEEPPGTRGEEGRNNFNKINLYLFIYLFIYFLNRFPCENTFPSCQALRCHPAVPPPESPERRLVTSKTDFGRTHSFHRIVSRPVHARRRRDMDRHQESAFGPLRALLFFFLFFCRMYLFPSLMCPSLLCVRLGKEGSSLVHFPLPSGWHRIKMVSLVASSFAVQALPPAARVRT